MVHNRQVTWPTKVLRQFLLGRKHNWQNRFPNMMADRHQTPIMMENPNYKLHDQYYFKTRNARRQVAPPKILYFGVTGQVRQTTKDVRTAVKPPGPKHKWDSHSFYELRAKIPCKPVKVKTSRKPELPTAPNLFGIAAPKKPFVCKTAQAIKKDVKPKSPCQSPEKPKKAEPPCQKAKEEKSLDNKEAKPCTQTEISRKTEESKEPCPKKPDSRIWAIPKETPPKEVKPVEEPICPKPSPTTTQEKPSFWQTLLGVFKSPEPPCKISKSPKDLKLDSVKKLLGPAPCPKETPPKIVEPVKEPVHPKPSPTATPKIPSIWQNVMDIFKSPEPPCGIRKAPKGVDSVKKPVGPAPCLSRPLAESTYKVVKKPLEMVPPEKKESIEKKEAIAKEEAIAKKELIAKEEEIEFKDLIEKKEAMEVEEMIERKETKPCSATEIPKKTEQPETETKIPCSETLDPRIWSIPKETPPKVVKPVEEPICPKPPLPTVQEKPSFWQTLVDVFKTPESPCGKTKSTNDVKSDSLKKPLAPTPSLSKPLAETTFKEVKKPLEKDKGIEKKEAMPTVTEIKTEKPCSGATSDGESSDSSDSSDDDSDDDNNNPGRGEICKGLESILDDEDVRTEDRCRKEVCPDD